MARRLGLTMRVDRCREDGEQRDALAADWASALARALGDVPWVPIPNLGPQTERFLQAWEIGAVILTGGNDVSACPIRDETERAAVAYCLRTGLPVLGICRGLQFLQVYFGGSLRPAPETHWGGRSHPLEICGARARAMLGHARIVVPSFHRHGVLAEELSDALEPWALSGDGFVEGLFHRTAPVMAVQWHPERRLPDPEIAVRLLRSFHRG